MTQHGLRATVYVCITFVVVFVILAVMQSNQDAANFERMRFEKATEDTERALRKIQDQARDAGIDVHYTDR